LHAAHEGVLRSESKTQQLPIQVTTKDFPDEIGNQSVHATKTRQRQGINGNAIGEFFRSGSACTRSISGSKLDTPYSLSSTAVNSLYSGTGMTDVE
jgi:hypothetical protein